MGRPFFLMSPTELAHSLFSSSDAPARLLGAAWGLQMGKWDVMVENKLWGRLGKIFLTAPLLKLFGGGRGAIGVVGDALLSSFGASG
jgi:hypothetical protein